MSNWITRSRFRIACAAFAFHSLAPIGCGWLATRPGDYVEIKSLILLGGFDLPLAPVYVLMCDGAPLSGKFGPWYAETAACLFLSVTAGGALYGWLAVFLERRIRRWFS